MISGPLLADVTGSVLESDTAVGIVEFSAREAHQVAFEDGGESLVLGLTPRREDKRTPMGPALLSKPW